MEKKQKTIWIIIIAILLIAVIIYFLFFNKKEETTNDMSVDKAFDIVMDNITSQRAKDEAIEQIQNKSLGSNGK